MHEIIEFIYDLLPGDKKHRGNGWTYFNCPMCKYTEMPDGKHRGNILLFDDGFVYQCFNCKFKCGFHLGQYFSRNCYSFLKELCSEKQMKTLGIDVKRCHLNGPTSDIQQEYINSSIFVFSSRFEGFGMVLIEAMACGLPIVSFDCPCGPKDIIKDGEDGLLVENGNIDLLASSLSRLMNDETLRQSMSKTGQKNAQRFSFEYVADQWRRLFESLNISAS